MRHGIHTDTTQPRHLRGYTMPQAAPTGKAARAQCRVLREETDERAPGGRQETVSRIRHLDLFSGIGGFSLAVRWLGHETVGFCEIDPWCRKVLDKHWPEVPKH